MKTKLHWLIVLVLLGITLPAKAAEEWIEVSTAEQFLEALHRKGTTTMGTTEFCANIRLTADIDMSEVKGSQSPPGTGSIFDYRWYGKISGLGYDENGEKVIYSLCNLKHTLFYALDHAELSDLLVVDGSFDGRDAGSGMLAIDALNLTLKNVWFINISSIGDSDVLDCDYTGIAVGNAENSTFSNLIFSNCQLLSDGYCVGHVAGKAKNCQFSNCITDGDSEIWADGNSDAVAGINSSAYAGGICGYADACVFEKCVNMSTVASDDDRIGGIIGYGTNTTRVVDCVNGGVIKHSTKNGFGVNVRETQAISLLEAAFADCGNYSLLLYGQLFSTKIDDMQIDILKTKWDVVKWIFKKPVAKILTGGFKYYNEWNFNKHHRLLDFDMALKEGIGYLVSALAPVAPEIVAIIALAKVATSAAIAFYNIAAIPDEMGGIAGTIVGNSSITRCTNHGPVTCKDDDCGGIVGHMENSTLESCYNRNFVRGTTDVGGIVGYCEKSVVKNCLNTACVTSEDTGYYGFAGKITNCESGNLSNNYFLYDRNQDHTVCQAFTQDKLASGWVAKQLNDALIAAEETPIWRQNLGGENGDFYPVIDNSDKPIVTSVAKNGSYSVVQKISTGNEFVLAVANPLAQISLQDDIDISCARVLLSTYSHPFKGVINGNGHRITDFSYESSSTDYKELDSNDIHDPHHIALFPYVSYAKFENFVIDNWHITQKDETNICVRGEALLAASANNSKFTNIIVRNSDIMKNSDNDTKYTIAALVAYANSDYFTDCTVESSCKFTGCSVTMNGNTGGLAAMASGSMFVRCHNASELWHDDDNVGGICGHAAGCGFVSCLNSGKVTGRTHVGGIAGYAGSCDITQCVNIGTICGDKNDSDNDHIAGIVGLLEDGVSSVKYCLSFGDLKDIDSDDTNGAIIGGWKNGNNANYVNNLYNYSHEGQNRNNLSDFGCTYDDVLSGKYAYNALNAEGEKYLYQSLDNDPYFTNLPVPLPAAGEVHRDYFCFRSNYSEYHYSNIYQSYIYNDHASQAKVDIPRWGFCTTCGNIPTGATVPKAITINDAADLVSLSKGVRLGINYSNTTITLGNDIDCGELTDFMPIGTSIEHPFRGTFLGNGHRIKNLHIKRISGVASVGLFGVVTGQTRIESVIMDESCSVDGGNSLGVGSLVGSMMTGTNFNSSYLRIIACGNEATVYGGENVAGLVGGVYDKAHDGAETSECQLLLTDCYNAGSISGNKVSAALVGYGHFWVLAYDCYNIGNVSGYIQGSSMIHYNKEKSIYADFQRIYQLEGLPADDNVEETVSTQQMLMGSLAGKLTPMTFWRQNLGTDLFPTPNANGKTVYHQRSMSSDWGTAMLPFGVQSNDNVQLYALKSTDLNSVDASITLKAVESVAANAPFFFKKKNASATSVSFNIASNGRVTLPAGDATSVNVATDAPGWSVTGTYNDLSDLTDVYFIAQNKLWFADEAIEVPAFRAYLTYNNSTSEAKSLRILVDEDGEIDQIGEMREGELHFYDGKYLENGRIVIHKGGKKYNTQGQLLN